MKKKFITVGAHERVVAAVPEFCAGPGWSNAPLWIYIINHQTKTFRAECLQPSEQSIEMLTMFATLNAAHGVMLGLVGSRLKEKRHPKGADVKEGRQ